MLCNWHFGKCPVTHCHRSPRNDRFCEIFMWHIVRVSSLVNLEGLLGCTTTTHRSSQVWVGWSYSRNLSAACEQTVLSVMLERKLQRGDGYDSLMRQWLYKNYSWPKQVFETYITIMPSGFHLEAKFGGRYCINCAVQISARNFGVCVLLHNSN